MNSNRINEFLQYWAKLALSNNYDFNNPYAQDQIYYKLTRLGVNNKDKDINLDSIYDNDSKKEKSIFQEWISYYRYNPRIDVFVSKNWSYFCQFNSKKEDAKNSDNHIKIYIPLDGNHIKKGAKLIFNFLSISNISHISKIGKNIRFDNIVIRLVNKEDTDKLLEFVKNNSYLQEGLIKANPFAVQKNGVALAVDGHISYNDTIASLIRIYLADCQREGKLNEVSYINFYYFIANKYNDEFVHKKSHCFENEFNFQNNETKKNYREVIELIILSQTKDFGYDNLIEHYYKSKRTTKNNSNSISTLSERLLLESIDEMSKRFNSFEKSIVNVEGYITIGNLEYLTRNNNLREKVSLSNMRNEILKYINKSNISIKQLINEVIKKYNYIPISNNNTLH